MAKFLDLTIANTVGQGNPAKCTVSNKIKNIFTAQPYQDAKVLFRYSRSTSIPLLELNLAETSTHFCSRA